MIIEMGSNQFQAILTGNSLNLQVIEGPAHDITLEIPKTKCTIGRKPTNTIHFQDDQHLSNLHSNIFFMEGGYYIEDMGPTNGTWERLSV